MPRGKNRIVYRMGRLFVGAEHRVRAAGVAVSVATPESHGLRSPARAFSHAIRNWFPTRGSQRADFLAHSSQDKDTTATRHSPRQPPSTVRVTAPMRAACSPDTYHRQAVTLEQKRTHG